MKILAASLVSATLFATPALAADTAHRTSVTHQGGTMSVSYEPRYETSHRQTGLGPRGTAGCLWTTRVTVERSVADAAGRPVAALTRTVGAEKVKNGMQVGYCHDMAPRHAAAFGGDGEKLRAHLTATAERDAHGLRGELASLHGLNTATAR